MEIEDIELRSDPVKEVLSRPPSWLIRWGVSAIFLVVALLVGITFIIKYPDTITAQATITTEKLPASIKALSSGQITHLFVEEGQQVTTDEVLAVIDNPADYVQMREMQMLFQAFHQSLIKQDSVRKLVLKQGFNLGEVQEDYTQFFKAHQDYWNFMETHIYQERIAQTRGKIIAQRQLSQGLSEQKAILLTDFALTKQQYQDDSLLWEKKVLAKRELEKAKQDFLQEQYRIKAFDVEQINADIRIQELEAQVLEFRQSFREERVRYLEALKQASLQLESAIATWEQRYVLQAPIEGKVSFFKFWSDNQFVTVNDEVMVVIPATQGLFGYMAVGQAGFGKVKEGQEVNIRFSGFPHQEFGVVKGSVTSISSIARDGKYMVHIALPNALKTTYGKELSFSQEMQGEAYIITEDLLLIQRMFYTMRQLWTK